LGSLFVNVSSGFCFSWHFFVQLCIAKQRKVLFSINQWYKARQSMWFCGCSVFNNALYEVLLFL
jgi:hypothetical protein